MLTSISHLSNLSVFFTALVRRPVAFVWQGAESLLLSGKLAQDDQPGAKVLKKIFIQYPRLLERGAGFRRQ